MAAPWFCCVQEEVQHDFENNSGLRYAGLRYVHEARGELRPAEEEHNSTGEEGRSPVQVVRRTP